MVFETRWARRGLGTAQPESSGPASVAAGWAGFRHLRSEARNILRAEAGARASVSTSEEVLRPRLAQLLSVG